METTELSLASLEFTVLEALIELMFVAAYADGEVNDAERSAFAAQIAQRSHGQLTPDVCKSMLDHIEARMTPEGREEVFENIRARIPQRLRREALGFMVNVVVADGVLKLDEVEVLKRAAKALEVELTVSDSVMQEAQG